MNLTTFVTSTGNLHQAYLELRSIPDISLCHARQIITARRHIPALQNQQIHAADGLVYFIENQKPKLAITSKESNPLLRHINVAYEHLRHDSHYRLNSPETLAIDSEMTIIDLEDIALLSKEQNDNRSMVVAIPTKAYHHLLDAQQALKKLAFQLFGPGRNFTRNMAKLAEQNIEKTSIVLLKPEYVLKEAGPGGFAQGGWLDAYHNGLTFTSDDSMFTKERSLCGITLQPELAFKDTLLKGTRAYSF